MIARNEIATRSLTLNQLRTFFMLFLLTTSVHTSPECHTPLLRDVIATDSHKLRYTLDNIGDSDPSFITGLPLINSSHPLTVRLSGFTTASLLLTERTHTSPNYWITAVDFQQGPAGRYCASSAVVREMSLEVKEGGGYRGVNTPFREGRDPSNSNPTLNLEKLGGTRGNGRVVRLSLQPVAGDGVRIKVLSIDPLTSSVQQEVCLRVEIYGCEKDRGSSAAPSVNTGPLHQYNLVQASADTYGNLYADSSYSGLDSDGYMTGGTGVLTDGIVGRDAVNRPAEWVGWERNKTSVVEILFLLKRSHHINSINIYYWEDGVAGLGRVRVSDQNNATIPLNTIQVLNVTQGLKLLTLSRERMTNVGYIKLSLGYDTYSDYVLITEIQIVGEVLGRAVNIVTGDNITTHTAPTSHTRTPVLNSTSSPSNVATSSPERVTTQLATTTTTTIITTTWTNIATNTTLVTITRHTSLHTNSTHSIYASEQVTYNKSTVTTTYTSNTTQYSQTFYSEELSSTSHSSTTALASSTCCSEQTVILVSAVGAGLVLSVCLNIIFILILTCCCCYCCCGRSRTKVGHGEAGRGEEEGTYVPMKSVELRSYHNILDSADMDFDSKAEQTDTQEYHYYSKIDDSPECKGRSPEKSKYYPFP